MSIDEQKSGGEMSRVLQHLIKNSGKTVVEISEECGIPSGTLYNMLKRNGTKADLQALKTLADYFGEDISIFLGLYQYERPIKLSPREKKLLENYRKLTDAAQTRIDGSMEDAVGNPKNLRKGP